MLSRPVRATAALVVVVVAGLVSGCGGSPEPSPTVDQSGTFTPGIPQATSTQTQAPSSTTRSAINSDGSYKSLDALRAAVTELGVTCGDWVKTTNAPIEAATQEGACDPDGALMLLTFENKDFNSTKVQQSLTAIAARRHAGGSKSTVILLGKDWAALGTNETVNTMNARMGGEIVAPFNTTTQFESPTS